MRSEVKKDILPPFIYIYSVDYDKLNQIMHLANCFVVIPENIQSEYYVLSFHHILLTVVVAFVSSFFRFLVVWWGF